MLNAVREFLRMESASGILLLIASVLAMVMANSPLSHLYDLFLDTPVAVKVLLLSVMILHYIYHVLSM